MANIGPILDSTKIALQKQATDMFGTAVEDFSRGTLGPAIGVPDPTKVDPTARNDGSWYSSSYAAALAGGTSYRPKMKFLFKVEFVFTPEAIAQYPSVLGGSASQDFTFMVKSVDRPKIDFEYEDDVNMYNFRTKVLKKIRHRELTITFMDDVGNRVLNFFRALMMIHSPITRRQMIRELSTYEARLAPPNANSIAAGNGMLFSPTNETTQNDNAIRGTFNSEVGNVIQTIRVKQMYVDPGAAIGDSVKEVIFDFLNARLVSFDLDDLSHEASDVNIMTMQFDYDWMEIVQVGSLKSADGPKYNITVPGIHGAPVDASPVGGALSPAMGSGGGNPFANILTNQLGRAAQTITSTAINKAVASVAGKGAFATAIGAQASGVLGGLLGAASQNLAGGTINQAVSGIGGLVSSASSGIKNLIVSPSKKVGTEGNNSVFDSANGGPSSIKGVVTSDSDYNDFGGLA